MKQIAVIGAGWYGCHISKKLLDLGNKVTVFERQSAIFLGASGCNQNRLHLGYHYPRCEITRSQSLKGFKRFKKEYDFLCEKIPENIYAISSIRSKLSFDEYLQSVSELAPLDKDQANKSMIIKNIENFINVDEEYINFEKAKKYFYKVLNNHIVFNSKMTKESVLQLTKEYDYVIDCTWGELSDFSFPRHYESNLFHLYKKKNNSKFALTIMDGYFFSIFPWQKEIYSLTNVKNIVLKKFKSFDESLKYNQRLRSDLSFIKEHRLACEKQVVRFYPDFHKHFNYFEPRFSNKTKFENSDDSRYVIIERDGNLIKVFSGKIDTVFDAEDKIITELNL
ncbi:MAG: hypothetical protein CMC82_05355 [Flavobacteriaceae bacterium]|nr:hypothetical protein [Flavobacteriaceae bacterium]